MADTNMKWQRDYVLTVAGRMPQKTVKGKLVPDPENQNQHVISMPITLEFDVNREMQATAQTGRFLLYNLKEETRRDLYHVWYEADQAYQQPISLFAGYQSQGDTRNCIFSGYILQCGSYRQGPDWVTEIEAFDSGLGNVVGNVSITLPKPANGVISGRELIKKLTSSMVFTQFGACGNLSVPVTRAISFVGSPFDVMQRIMSTGGQVFVDNGNLYALGDNEYVVKPGMTGISLNSDQILGSPKRQGSTITVTTLLEPSPFLGAVCKLSSRDQDYNGTWQIRGVHHKGTISAATCGEATTTLQLFSGTAPLVPVEAER